MSHISTFMYKKGNAFSFFAFEFFDFAVLDFLFDPASDCFELNKVKHKI